MPPRSRRTARQSRRATASCSACEAMSCRHAREYGFRGHETGKTPEETMIERPFSRRAALKGTAALTATMFAQPLRAALPEASPITPALIDAAKKEGKLVFYTAMDLQLAEHYGKMFEQKY